LPAEWISELETPGIAVGRDVLRSDARIVLQNYGVSGQS